MGKKLKRIGVLTSGGDAPGMNAAVRAVVRTALHYGTQVFAIKEGYQGMVDGGKNIFKMDWNSTGGILHQGGTVIGTARCNAFKTFQGQLDAAKNLLSHNIDRIIVIGGDGSLTGASEFQKNWPDLLKTLVDKKEITEAKAKEHPHLLVVGLVGSIDNDMCGTDMTIGADTALHRISYAVDAINSTAASHQRTFVVEVMGRRCGYLALMSALVTGADWVFVPERPANAQTWEEDMCSAIREGREAGRRATMVIIAEGSIKSDGSEITSAMVKQVLEKELKADVRVTILGHVQRGGSPSAFDRNLSSVSGYAAVKQIIAMNPGEKPKMIGVRHNRLVSISMEEALKDTKAVETAIIEKNFQEAMRLRGDYFNEFFNYVRILKRPLPPKPQPRQQRVRIGILHAGAPTPGMNCAVRAAVRFCIDKGHEVVGIRRGFKGLIEGNQKSIINIRRMDWMSVNGWASIGGALLGINRKIPKKDEWWRVATNIEKHKIQGLMIIGSWPALQAAHEMYMNRHSYPVFNIPVVCLPATISNSLPGFEVSVGADTAINNIMEAVDKIKQSAVATRLCFIVEVVGLYCGYIALMSGLATGAERIYMQEDGIALKDLQKDLNNLLEQFKQDRRMALIIRNEKANPSYDISFMTAFFGEESKEYFNVSPAILGHLQQGGDPSPFDRIQAVRFAYKCVEFLVHEALKKEPAYALMDMRAGKVNLFKLKEFRSFVELSKDDVTMGDVFQRARKQWWMGLRPIAKVLARAVPSPSSMHH